MCDRFCQFYKISIPEKSGNRLQKFDWFGQFQMSKKKSTQNQIKDERVMSEKEYSQKLKTEEKDSKELDKKFGDYLKKTKNLSEKESLRKIHTLSDGKDIFCHDITLNAGGFKLLEDASLKLSKGRRYGLIGRNGSGKTTLLRAMDEFEIPDLPKDIQIMHIEQEVPPDDTPAIELILRTDIERESLIREEKEILADSKNKNLNRLTEIHSRMEEIDVQGAVSRVSVILHGLGFTSEMQKMTTKEFSGGWRMRLALARSLFIQPDLLLLDEPTNHLDLHAVLWLEKYLLDYEKTVLVVSHDRRFLNEVCTDIIHLDQQKLTNYKGDFDSFEKVVAELQRAQQTKYDAQQKQKEHAEKFINRFKASSRAHMVQSKIKHLKKVEYVEEVTEQSVFSFEIRSPDEEKAPYISAENISFAYPEKENIINDMSFTLDADSRIALVGKNGAGKSTFLKILEGELEVTDGYITRNSKVKVAKFSQHHVDHLNLKQTALEFMQTKFPGVEKQILRSVLGGIGLTGELAVQPIYTLSGGQKSRIMFAMISYMRPHILLLDEPTNHLDIETVDALIDALRAYVGGVLVVTHDQHLIESLGAEIWVVENNTIKKFRGDFEEYRELWDKEYN
jgi:ATP-binding cassette subfamily F protein 3